MQKLFLLYIIQSFSDHPAYMYTSRKRFHDLNVPLCVKNFRTEVALSFSTLRPEYAAPSCQAPPHGTPCKHAWKILTYCWPDLTSIEIAWDQMEWRNSPHSQFPRNALIKSCRCSASLCLDFRPVCHSLSKDTTDVKKNIITLHYNIIIFR